MITNYSLSNFKIHDHTNLELGRVTLLTGMNGMGKSSVIQSMLLLRESYMKKDLPEQLSLRGDSFYVGSSSGVINWNPTDNSRQLSIGMKVVGPQSEIESYDCRFVFDYPESDRSYLQLSDADSSFDYKRLGTMALFNQDFQYLSAFRYGPLDSYQSEERTVDTHRQISKLMGRGEYGIYFLERYGMENIPIEALNYKPESETDLSLKKQVELWLNEIAVGTSLKIDRSGDRYALKLAYKRHGKAPYWVDALNTGFGISYTLSLLIAILSARPGALILLENPEAHIHPGAQAGLMRLVSLAAANGVQFVIETHSDHIVNGALVGLKREILPQGSLSVYYFERDMETNNAHPHKLVISEESRIDHGPDGFFTQMRSDLEILFGFDD